MKRTIFLLLVFLFLSSCATHQSRVAPSRELLSQGQCDTPLEQLKKLSEKEDGDQLVHLLEYASALQICEKYNDSNKVLIQADRLADQLDYTSVSRVTGAALLNEEMIQYKGDTFEKLFINVMAALNFIQLNQFDSAMVEVRRINDKFKKLNTENKKKFELNSLAKYLSGLIYELDKKYDDACIAYGEAYKIDPTYRVVAIDVLRACKLAQRSAEFDKWAKEIKPTPDELLFVNETRKNEKIIIYLQGWGPRKSFRANDGSFPQLVPVSSQVKSIRIKLLDKSWLSEKVYDVEKAAVATLEDDYGSFVARRIGARVAKEAVAAGLKQRDQALGQVAHFVMLAAERPDLRQWSILPQTVQIVRFVPAASTEELQIWGLNSSQQDLMQMRSINYETLKQNKVFIVRSLK